MWSLALEVIFLATFFFTSALYEPSVCQDCCSDGSCCEVQLNRAACCPFVNGVCCAGGKTCCPQGSVCDAAKTDCTYPNTKTTIPMKDLVTQRAHGTKTLDEEISKRKQKALELGLQAEDCLTATFRRDTHSDLPGSNICLS
ncbi:hypothetical protein P879_10159 [Paragonimus westermani]|uniref:Granulins domain-containing protein n=1 Tax=Paragonimus westermani TaxID=34504 RepID=A0A8T0CZ76_9TREM|nr:hypothetical protein P879_10159 [Paragonimus westermani]